MPSDDSAAILLIDDDEQLGEVLTTYLGAFNLRLEVAHAPSEAFARLAAGAPDLILLDVMLPEQDGFSVCREIAGQPERYGGVPIIMLTARGDVIDRVVGLELGADDYLAKPFEPRELLARIRSCLRRRAARPVRGDAPAATAAPDGLRIDTAAHRAWVDGEPIELTGMEFALLALLMSQPGRVFSRDEIMDALKGIDADVYSRAIDAAVSRLRQKLRDDTRQPRFVRTVWGRGYAYVTDGAKDGHARP